MSGIWGLIGINENDYAYVNTIGQQVVYEATQMYLNRVNADMMKAMGVLVQGNTDLHQERYKLPGGGYLARRGGAANSPESKAYGSWDVAYPLEDWGAQVAETDVAMAYMTPQDYRLHVESVITRDINTVRFEILRRIFKNTTDTFVDPQWGSLTIQALANGDAVVYPPVIGSNAEATDNHYLESGYAAGSISNTNNPLITIRNELTEHYQRSTGGENVVVFFNSAQIALVQALSSFTDVPDQFIIVGQDTDVPTGYPDVPGKIIGRADGCWVVQWDWIPAGYAFGVYLGAPAPLRMRIDPAATGLGVGLQLVAQRDEFPIQSAEWRHRFGVGTANRLNGVVMEFGTGGTYTIPTAYA